MDGGAVPAANHRAHDARHVRGPTSKPVRLYSARDACHERRTEDMHVPERMRALCTLEVRERPVPAALGIRAEPLCGARLRGKVGTRSCGLENRLL
jgi:hypothetical protein